MTRAGSKLMLLIESFQMKEGKIMLREQYEEKHEKPLSISVDCSVYTETREMQFLCA
jgi:hypothetical protein